MARFLSCLVMVLLVLHGAVLSSSDNSAESLDTCNRGDWRSINGRLIHVSVGRAGVWGVTIDKRIWYRSGSYENETYTGDTWVPINCCWEQVDVGRDVVWAVPTNIGKTYYRQGITANTPYGLKWVPVVGSMTHVSVSQKGHVWGVSSNKNVYHRLGASVCSSMGAEWRRIGSGLVQISVGSGGVWGVTPGGYVYYREDTFGDHDSDAGGSHWSQISGRLLKYISSSDMIYGVNSVDEIVYRQGVSSFTPKGAGWQVVPGSLKQVESLSHVVWGIDAQLMVFVKETDDPI
ncbi:uncharacterized protein [Asterias amurensis]|uniref:uncharacterized protein n=1 Tax=Asterias amurensis TaxID=7602 RepID=UPI003AB513D0